MNKLYQEKVGKISNGVKPRILIFSIAYDPMVGGAELAVRNLTSHLLSYDFDLITCRFDQSHKPVEKIGNVMVYRVGFGSRLGRYLYPVFAFRLAKKLHRQKNYQIIWAIMAAYAGGAALLFKRRFPAVKFLLTLQEGDPIEHIHRQVRGFRRQWQKLFEKADYIQAISKFLADWARKEGANCPVEVVPNGVTPSVFSPLTPTVSSGLIRGRLRGGRNSKFVVITTSRLVPKNGIDILIRAAAGLKTLIRDSRFAIRIIGIGPEEQSLKNLVEKLEVTDIVEFLGEVPAEQIPEYLWQADVFVRPSRSEGLGTSFLEAMAAGLPVIGTPVGGIPDFLFDRKTGLFCKPDDPQDLARKIVMLLENETLAKELRENGQKLVAEKYSWDIIAEQMKKIFERILL